MYGVAGEKRPIFLESDAFLYNLNDPTLVVSTMFHYLKKVPTASIYRENPKIGNYHTLVCPYVKPYTLVA
jgi:hypothetical protein